MNEATRKKIQIYYFCELTLNNYRIITATIYETEHFGMKIDLYN